MGGIPIAVRHIESVLRMAEANAKLHLRDYVRTDDIDSAIDMMLDSFEQSQKASIARQLHKKFEKYRSKKNDPNQLLVHLLKKIVNDRAIYEKYIKGIEQVEKVDVRIPIDTFEHEARDYAHASLTDFYKSSLFNKDFKFDGRHILTTTKI